MRGSDVSFKGIIFDFNGVLLKDSHLHESAWMQFSQTIRTKPLSVEEMKIHIHGRSTLYTFEYLLKRKITAEELDQLVDKKESIYRKLCLGQGDSFALSRSTIDLLNYLVDYDIPRTIATASEKTNLDFFIKNLGLEQWFDIQKVIYDNRSFPGKPEPDFYLKAAIELGLKPSECIVVEDSYSGIESAYRAGIGYIISFGPRKSHPELIQLPGVDCTIESFKQFSREKLIAATQSS